MKYIYDILLNWTDNIKAYEFYEWQKDDDLEHIKKMPIIRIDSICFNSISISQFIVNHEFLTIIDQKTETFTNKVGSIIEKACLFTDGNRALAIEFDKKGRSIYRSNLLLDTLEEVLDLTDNIKPIKLDYKIIATNKKQLFLTRFEQEVKQYLLHEFSKIYKSKNINKLKYLYYEWYNTTSNDFNFMFNKIKKILDMEWNNNHINFYNLIKLSYAKK